MKVHSVWHQRPEEAGGRWKAPGWSQGLPSVGLAWADPCDQHSGVSVCVLWLWWDPFSSAAWKTEGPFFLHPPPTHPKGQGAHFDKSISPYYVFKLSCWTTVTAVVNMLLFNLCVWCTGSQLGGSLMCQHLKSTNVARIGKWPHIVEYYNSIKYLCDMSALTLQCNRTASFTASASKGL